MPFFLLSVGSSTGVLMIFPLNQYVFSSPNNLKPQSSVLAEVASQSSIHSIKSDCCENDVDMVELILIVSVT